MTSESDSIRAFMKSFDRAGYADEQRLHDEQRQMMLELFPRSRWPEMSLTDFALGHSENDQNFCAMMEFQAGNLGSIRGGSAAKHIIYHHRSDGWKFNEKLFRNEKEAWEEIRKGFIRSFDLAEAGRFEEIDAIPALSWGPMLRTKTLYLYFPQDILPVYSYAHMRHFLRKLGRPEAIENDYRAVHLNQILLATLREFPESEGLTNLELAVILYRWSNPREDDEGAGYDLSEAQMEMLWSRFHSRISGFTDFTDPGEKLRELELGYKREVLQRYERELGNEQMQSMIEAGNATQALQEFIRVAGANLVAFQSWRTSFGEDEESIAAILGAFLEVARKPYERTSDLRPIREAIRNAGLKPSWDTMSTTLWVMRPSDYFPIKISYYRSLASELGMELPKGRPGPVNFAKVWRFMAAFRDALEPYRPTDWVDVQSFVWCVCPDTYSKPVDDSDEETEHELDVPPTETVLHAHNQILCGPPGTGKTYSTIRLAVEIVDGESPESADEAKARYDELVQESRIEFVTFHQSYSYDDFVEGIRPVMDDEESGTPRYECRDGVFKRICTAARDEVTRPRSTPQVDIEGARIWKMSLGNTRLADDTLRYEDAIENRRISLGWGDQHDCSDCSSVAEIASLLGPEASTYAARAVHQFKNEMEVGDLVVVSDGNHRFRAVGRITGPYEYRAGDEFPQRRGVEWIRVFKESQAKERILKEKAFSQATIYEISKKDLDLRAFGAILRAPEEGSTENHVLIIDEINRGNISKIFGELITLIEKDKRAGARNALTVLLPASQQRFTVPGNLYIVGTMNTADKSIALVDTALRRRFRFVELMPDFSVCPGLTTSMRKVLSELNRRITIRKDRDHQIGHSYFIDVRDDLAFNRVFEDSVLALLREYFYNDWDGLRFVLGEEGGASGRFVKSIADTDNRWARTKWTWYRDTGEKLFDYLGALEENYARRTVSSDVDA